MAGGEKTAENFISGILRGDLLALSDFLGSGYVLLVCAILVFVLDRGGGRFLDRKRQQISENGAGKSRIGFLSFEKEERGKSGGRGNEVL